MRTLGRCQLVAGIGEFTLLRRVGIKLPSVILMIGVILLLESCADPVELAPSSANSTGASEASDTRCTGPGAQYANRNGRVDRVAASYRSTNRDMVRYQESRSGKQGPGVASYSVRNRPPDEGVSLCYYDGVFDLYKGPPPPTSGSPPAYSLPTRLSLLVFEDGTIEVEGFGRREDFPASGPTPSQ